MSIENKLERMQEDITDIKVILAQNTTSLELHMRRTEASEKRLAILEKYAAMAVGGLGLLSLATAMLEAFKK